MSSLLNEKRDLEDGDSSSPKCTRQKVSIVRNFPRGCGPNAASVVRNFPRGCGPNAASICVQAKAKEEDNLKDAQSCGKTGRDIKEVEEEQLKKISAKNLNTSEEIRNDPEELFDVLHNKIREETNVVQCLLPHYPVPSNLILRERKYPSPRTASAVRNFPASHDCNLNHVVEFKTNTTIQNQNKKLLDESKKSEDKIQGIVSGKHKVTYENPSVDDEVVAGKTVIQAHVVGQRSEIAQEKVFVDDKGKDKSGYNRNDESAVGNSSIRPKNGIMGLVKDNDEKIKSNSDGSLSNNIKLQKKTIEAERGVIVLGLTYAASYPLKKVKTPAKLSPSSFNEKESMGNQDNGRCSRTRRKDNATLSRMEKDEENDVEFLRRPHNYDVTLPPFGAYSSSERGARTKVRETLRLFQAIVRKILQGEETNSKENEKGGNWAHLQAANILKEKGKYINTEKRIGIVPGIDIGDIFSYRLELAIIGLHGPFQSGIDTIMQGDAYLAISVVASEGYDNDLDNPNVLIYTGHGGSLTGLDQQPEDQKPEQGNLALKNSIDKKNPVRVIRGFKETKLSENADGKSNMITTYTYDGLYTVEQYWHEVGPHGSLIYKFELIRMPGQLPLAWKEVKHSKKFNTREGLYIDDISKGKERIPICAVNTINNEKPPPFTYITSNIYPDWCRPLPLKGCDCNTDCSDPNRCACALQNGGEIPYNLSGAIVEAKSIVYECGPSCNCGPSCCNRVSQHGIKLPLEIFRTGSMGWGVRCLSYIPSGSFICEYIGELLDDREAEQRVGSDEYLFDIGQNYNEVMPKVTVQNVGFTIDAAKYGNIGRFVNHSCSPNLYAQNILYDHEDERIPHVMLFAAENIPPLQELTYHYNYTIDQVLDSNGNIKRKDCYCGSVECSGRMY